ncbi:unnamed protein product [Rangifer tarandus platyrhynchus]|uniref:Uncharacterized protein n=2 Tax=Rangifer tarandus platyrhynchus TaxID=3082113 RepID=A0ABN8YJN8_RANTA|nr:unnamed protein product [Rangifer tarandus platyrhynchus]
MSEPRRTRRAGKRRDHSPCKKSPGPHSDPDKAHFQPLLTSKRACSCIYLPSYLLLFLFSPLSATPHPAPALASPFQSLSCGWSSSGPVIGPFGVGGNVEAYLEQRLCGLRKISPHFPSHLHLSGLWAAQGIRPGQASLWPPHSSCSDASIKDAHQCIPSGLCCLLPVGTSWRRSTRDSGDSPEEGGAQSEEITALALDSEIDGEFCSHCCWAPL